MSASGRLLTVPQFAHATGITERAIRESLRRGELAGTRLGNRWYIPPSELMRLGAGDAKMPHAGRDSGREAENGEGRR